jgi:hypothetical protein
MMMFRAAVAVGVSLGTTPGILRLPPPLSLPLELCPPQLTCSSCRMCASTMLVSEKLLRPPLAT